MPPLAVAPALLCKNKTEFLRKMRLVHLFVQRAQVDLMDGKFVKNKTIEPEDLLHVQTTLKLEFQLMVRDPLDYIERLRLLQQKPWMIIVHRESCKSEEELFYLIKHLHHHDIRAGIAINPETPVSKIKNVARFADLVLVMTVHPGFGGQDFLMETLPKIKKLREMLPKIDIEVDGGIDEQTALLAARAGANVLVAGTTIFNAVDPKEAVDRLIAAGLKGREED